MHLIKMNDGTKACESYLLAIAWLQQQCHGVFFAQISL